MKKAVKSIFFLIMVIGLICTLAACNDITGHYVLVSVEMQGVIYDASDLGYLDLNEDGTGFMSINGEEFEMCWADGQIWPVSDPDDIVSFTVDGDTIILDLNGNTAILKKA